MFVLTAVEAGIHALVHQPVADPGLPLERLDTRAFPNRDPLSLTTPCSNFVITRDVFSKPQS